MCRQFPACHSVNKRGKEDTNGYQPMLFIHICIDRTSLLQAIHTSQV